MNVAEEHRQCKFNSSDPQIRIGGSLFKKAEGLRVEVGGRSRGRRFKVKGWL